jgi:RND superfamily putative drug exporter
MGRLSQWAVRRPWWALATWIVIMVVVGVVGTKWGGSYNNNFSLPNTESTTAQKLLESISGGGAGTGSGQTGQVVWTSQSGNAVDPAATAAMTAVFTQLSKSPDVTCVITPFGEPLGSACPPAQPGQGGGQGQSGGQGSGQGQGAGDQPTLSPAAAGALAHIGEAGVSPDGSVAYATVIYTWTDLNAIDDQQLASDLDVIKAQNGRDGLTVGANGLYGFVQGKPPSSEGIGITVALFILLFAFASVIGALLPIWMATVAVGISTGFALPIAAHFMDVAVFTPMLASMIGLGVGIDYSLFIVNRYREALIHGREPREAALESMRTSGRSVLFAAITVMIALLGLLVLRLTFFNGIAVSLVITVFLVMFTALLLLPAILGILGTWVFLGRMAWIRDPEAVARQRAHGLLHGIAVGVRWFLWVIPFAVVSVLGVLWRAALNRGATPDLHRPSAFAKYGNWLQKRPWITATLALVFMIVIALPMLSLRQGFTDDGGAPVGTPQRIAYDLTASGFGAGVNGPFYVAVQLPQAGDQQAVTDLTNAINQTTGVAIAVAPPVAPDQTVAPIQVYPTTSPQDVKTNDLLNALRSDVIPKATADSGATAYVGGFQAVTADFTDVLKNALPWFLLIVVGLGFLALVVLFRSLLVPLLGVGFSLLSFAAALGITVAVFQWGWFSGPLAVQSTGPIFPFLPIMVFSFLFGLSCDYQVFLVSRMHEEWMLTQDNRTAVRRGLAGSGRVVAIAAAIMTSVFGSFALDNDPTIKLFGVALSTAVLLDAFVVRLVIVPSLMTIFGPRNWYLPQWLGNVLPHVSVESEMDARLGDDEIADIEDPDAPRHSDGDPVSV